MPEIILVPTSHVAKESILNVKKAIEKEKPDCVAVEMDINRYQYFRQQSEETTLEMIRLLGVPTFLIYWVLKKFQSYFGRKTGIFPGSEMMEAAWLAKEKGIAVALIDQRIEVTLAKIRGIPLSGKLAFFRLLIMGFFGLASPFGKKQKLDLNRIPSKQVIEEAMKYMRKNLPDFYRVLVEERNAVMAKNLKDMSRKFDRIVCVIGAGHEKGITKLLSKDY